MADMPPAKVCKLMVRPIQSSDLAFGASGIIDYHNMDLASLGSRVPDHKPDIDAIYADLGKTVDGKPERLFYDAGAITTAAAAWSLFALRSRSLATALSQAIGQREIAYLRKYKHQQEIIQQVAAVHDPTSGSKPTTLTKLLQTIGTQHDRLLAAYRADARLDVVRDTVTTSNGLTLGAVRSDASGRSRSDATASSKADTTERSTQAGNSNVKSTATTNPPEMNTTPISMITRKHPDTINLPNGVPPDLAHNHSMLVLTAQIDVPAPPPSTPPTLPTQPYWAYSQQWVTEDTINVPFQYNGSDWVESTAPFKAQTQGTPGTSTEVGRSTSTSTASGSSHLDASSRSSEDASTASRSRSRSESNSRETVVGRGYDYRHPSAENDARFQRGSIDLGDEILDEFLANRQVSDLGEILTRELESIDLAVRTLQVAFLETILVSPLPGVVSVIYKDIGEAVQAGSPVVRVENDAEVLIVGTIQHRGPLMAGPSSAVTIHTNIFGSGALKDIPGYVAAVRGHDPEDEVWEVVFRCKNLDSSNNPILPLNYNFDWDDTTLTFG